MEPISKIERRLLDALNRVPMIRVNVIHIDGDPVVTIKHGDTRIGAYATMPAAVGAARQWAKDNGRTEPVLILPCGTQIAACDYEAYSRQFDRHRDDVYESEMEGAMP